MLCDYCGEDCFDARRRETRTFLNQTLNELGASQGLSGYSVTEEGGIACLLCAVQTCADCGLPLEIHYGTTFADFKCPLHGIDFSGMLCFGWDYRERSKAGAKEAFKRYCQFVAGELRGLKV